MYFSFNHKLVEFEISKQADAFFQDMEALSFAVLKISILSLFDETFSLHGPVYNYADLLASIGSHNFKNVMNKLLKHAIGDVEIFRERLKIELNQFFIDFHKYFQTDNERMNERRFNEYKKLILDRQFCKRKCFKRELIKFIRSDLYTCYVKNSNQFSDQYKDVSKRQKVVLASIKNFIYRTFLINEYLFE